MCLDSRFSSQSELDSRIPGDEFVVFKVLAKQGDRLVSPSYTHKKWMPGDVVSSGADRSNGDSGIYVFLVPPGPTVVLRSKGTDQRVVRMTVKREDVVWGGCDNWGGHKGTCLVVRKVHITGEDYDDALSDRQQEILHATIRLQANKTINQGKARVKKAKVVAEKAVKTAKKKTTAKKATATAKAKTLAKKATKATKAATTKKKTSATAKKAAATIKKAKAAVKKTAKTSKSPKKSKTATAAAKLVKSAKKTAKSAKKAVKAKAAVPGSTLTVSALRTIAKSRNISGYSRMSKTELLKILKRHL